MITDRDGDRHLTVGELMESHRWLEGFAVCGPCSEGQSPLLFPGDGRYPFTAIYRSRVEAEAVLAECRVVLPAVARDKFTVEEVTILVRRKREA